MLKKFTLLMTIIFFNSVWAADLPKIDCVLTDKVIDDQAASEKSTFTPNVPYIHLVCQSDKVSKGQNIKAVWIADNTNGAAPDNYKIDEKGLLVAEDLDSTQIWTADYKLSKPDAGWPEGSYQADLYVDDTLYKSYSFNVK